MSMEERLLQTIRPPRPHLFPTSCQCHCVSPNSRFHRGNSNPIPPRCCLLYCNTHNHEHHTKNRAPEARTVVNGWGRFGAGSNEGGGCDCSRGRAGMDALNAHSITSTSEGEARGSTGRSGHSSVNNNARRMCAIGVEQEKQHEHANKNQQLYYSRYD